MRYFSPFQILEIQKRLDFRTTGIAYLTFRLWINVWSGIILIIMVATDASALVSYITRFTEESFAALISFIFIYESMAKLMKILSQSRTIEWNPVRDDGRRLVP